LDCSGCSCSSRVATRRHGSSVQLVAADSQTNGYRSVRTVTRGSEGRAISDCWTPRNFSNRKPPGEKIETCLPRFPDQEIGRKMRAVSARVVSNKSQTVSFRILYGISLRHATMPARAFGTHGERRSPYPTGFWPSGNARVAGCVWRYLVRTLPLVVISASIGQPRTLATR
jgi:hypothetical protein